MNSSDFKSSGRNPVVPSPHWSEPRSEWSVDKIVWRVSRPIENRNRTSMFWVSPRTFLFAIYLLVILSIFAFFQIAVSWQAIRYPEPTASVVIGLVFGILAATQSWDLGTRWTMFLRLISGLVVVQVVFPVLARQLGGPAPQWWSALVLFMLISQAINSILNQGRLVISEATLQHRSWFSLGLVDLLSFSCVLGMVFQLGKYAYQYPLVVLQCFAWFGGFATIVSISRFALLQMSSIWKPDATARPSGQLRTELGAKGPGTEPPLFHLRLNAILETVGIALIIGALDAGILYWLHQSRGSLAGTYALFTILLAAQIWQVLDLWVQHLLLLQKTKLSRPHFRIDVSSVES